MKKAYTFLLIALALGISSTNALGQLYLKNALLYVDSGATLFVNDSMIVKSEKNNPSQIKNLGRVEVDGNFNVDQYSVVSGDGVLKFSGKQFQKLVTHGVPLKSIEVSNDDSVTLGDDLTVTNNITLQKGFITLGSNNMFVSDSIKISGGSDSSYIRINGNGKLVAKVDTGSKLFPVGRNPYLPVVITNGGGAEFQIGVHDKIYENPESQLTELTKEVVTETWSITVDQDVNNVELQFGWDPVQETNDFNRNASHISWWKQGNSNEWTSTGQGAASGTGPYFQSIKMSTLTSGSYFFGIGGTGSALPVEFTFFKAQWQTKGEIAILEWQTAMEENNSHFEIERSFDATNWDAVGRVEGQGTTFDITDYQYIDNGLPITNNNSPITIYYRLKQIDYNGQFEYSETRTLNFKPETLNSLELWPNPNSDQWLNINQIGNFEIISISGTVLKTAYQTSRIYIEDLSPGTYLVRNEKGQMQKLVVR
ncbi:MAG: T9SS type A sorting domain-containing protein [Bacteroidia bacterium]